MQVPFSAEGTADSEAIVCARSQPHFKSQGKILVFLFRQQVPFPSLNTDDAALLHTVAIRPLPTLERLAIEQRDKPLFDELGAGLTIYEYVRHDGEQQSQDAPHFHFFSPQNIQLTVSGQARTTHSAKVGKSSAATR